MGRRIAIFALVFLAILGLLVGAVLLFATSEIGAREISKRLKEELRRTAGLDVAFSDIDVEIFPPRIRVERITASDIKARVSCRIAEAEIAPAPLDLIRGALRIEEIYLGTPECAVRLAKADLDPLLKRGDAAAPMSRLDLESLPGFDVIAVSQGALTLDVDDAGRLGAIHLAVNGLGLDVTGQNGTMEVRGLVERIQGTWSEGGRKVDETVKGLELRAAVGEHGVDIRHLDADAGGAKISLRDAHVPIPLWPQGPDVADLSVDVPLDLLNRLPLDLPEMSGRAGFLGQVSARKDADRPVGVSARGRVRLEKAAVSGFVIGDLGGLVSLTPRGVAFAETEIDTADGHLSVSGNIAFDEGRSADIRGTLDGIELAHLLEQLHVPGAYVTQKMTGPFALTGRLKPLRLEGDVRIGVKEHNVLTAGYRSKNPPVVLHVPEVAVEGKVAITEHFFEGRGLSVRLPRSALVVDMHMDFDHFSWWLKASSRDFHLEDIKRIAGFELAGHGPLSCAISGPLDNPQIVGFVDFDRFSIDGFGFDHVATNINYHDLWLTFEGMTASRGRSRASTSELVVDFNTKRGLTASTKIEVEKVAVEDVARLFEIDTEPYGSPTGLLFGRVAVDYASVGKSLRVSADLTHDELVVFGERFGPDVLRVDWQNGELTVSELGLTKGKGTISLTGAVRTDRSMNIVGIASGIATSAIDNPLLRKYAVDTVGQAFVVVEGTVDNPKGWGEIRLGELTYRGTRYGPSQLSIAIDGPTVTGQGKLLGEDVALEHLEVDLGRMRFSVEGFAYDFDLARILDVDTGGHRASVRLTGELSLTGRFAKKPSLAGFASFDHVVVGFDDFVFENEKPLRLSARADQVRFRRTRFSGRDVVFELGGMVGLDRMNLEVRGLVGLAKLAGMSDAIERSDGVIGFSLRAAGPLGAPALSGTAEIENGAVTLAGFPSRIERIRGRIQLSPKVIRFLEFNGHCAGGSLGAEGEIRLAGGRIADYQFNLTAADVELALLDDLTFTASTTNRGLELRSPQRGGLPKIVGDVEIRDLRYTADIRVLEISDLNVDRLGGARLAPRRPKLVDEKNEVVAFDVRLHGDRNLEAHNNLFDATLVIDDVERPLRLVGTNQSFGFLGRVLGKTGQVRFAGKRFDLKYAAIDFKDAARPDNPSFLVTADGQVRDWQVTMTAEGTVDEYELRLSAQPYLPKEDIVFLILTGLTRAENRQFGGSGLSLGTPILGQLGPGGGEIPVELQVYNEYSEKAGTDTTRVALGRWVTQDVWISISSSIGQDRDVEAGLDYKINDQFSLSAGYENDNEGSVGNIGLDLKFRLEF